MVVIGGSRGERRESCETPLRWRQKRTGERFMTSQNFTTTFSVDQTPQEVFEAIKNVRGWWSEEIEGSTDKVGDEFT
jgi:hypothetical protein